MPAQYPDEETAEKWRKDPGNWKWGVFYYNAVDKRVFVSKRAPFFGVTVNFAHPYTFRTITIMIIIAAFFICLKVFKEFINL
jgi:uncharacterized membrane protein